MRARLLMNPFARLAPLCAACLIAAGPSAAQTPAPAAPARAVAPVITDTHAVDPHAYRARAVRLPSGAMPKIDGRLDDAVWQLAPVNAGFIQRDPDVGAPASERTEFRVLYDNQKLYVATWCYDEDPRGIIASEMMRDALLRKGDTIRFVLDTFHDHRNAYYFGTNPLGAAKDGFSSDNGRMNWDWNAVWEVKSTRDEKGWYAEFAVPLGQLRFKGGAGEQTWGFNIGRSIVRRREDSSFTPYPREWGPQGFSRVSGAGLLVGLEGLQSRRRLEFIPFLAPQVTRDIDAGTPASVKRGYGMDLRVGVTETINADLTYKTDFAQVEADQEVVNLTRFNLFFPEKRQFFTEGANTFNYGRVAEDLASVNGDTGLLSIFYSRSIGLSRDGREVPLVGGGRLSGSAGPYTVGLINIETDEADYVVGGRAVHVPRANYSVARLKRNVLGSSTIGAIALNREGAIGPASYNRAVGFDGIFTLPRNVRVATMLARTFSPGVSGRDMAGVLDLYLANDRYTAGANYTDIQEAFNAEMGFIPRRDIRRRAVSGAWTPRPRWQGVRQLTIGAANDNFENHQGTPQSHQRNASFLVTANDRSTFKVAVLGDYDLLPVPFRIGPAAIPRGGYSWNTLSTAYASNDSRRIHGGGGIDIGGYYNGDKRTLKASLNVLPLETLLVENSYTRNRITLPGVATYVTNTLTTRASYSLSPTLFLKAFIQYNDERKTASLNLLLWSIYRPGSDLYVVYNQGIDTDAPGPATLRVRNRQLSVKLTRWLSR